MNTILVIDDDPEICETLESLVKRLSHHCFSVQTLRGARLVLKQHQYDVVFLDVSLPDGNGLDLLAELAELDNPPEVIILTGRGDPDGAELAIKGGVWDYVLKPSSVKEISLTLDRALRYRKEKSANINYDSFSFGSIVGSSSAIKAAGKQIAQAAKSESNLLITGETGTGKEVFARAVHENSNRLSGRFVVVDCGALNESMVGSILFGHRKGSTGDDIENQSGLINLAHKGTLFLDEIGEMSNAVQKLLLRVLQEHTFRAVGDFMEQSSNFRLIASTNKDLDEMVENGNFRRELLHRIMTMKIHVPPLRQRRGDIKLLAAYKVEELCNKNGMEIKLISTDFFETLDYHDWPGNVRELFNMIERAVFAAGSEKKLFAMHLPRSLRVQVAKAQIKKMTGSETLSNDTLGSLPVNHVRKIGHDIFQDIFDRQLPNLKEFKGTAEEVYLGELIRQGGGDIGKILEISGLSRSHFYSLLKKYNLSIQSG